MSIQTPYRPDHKAKADWLLEQMRRNNGLAPVDLDRFYADQKVAEKDPFGWDIPQVASGVWLNWECVFDELGIAEDYWRFEHDEAWRFELSKAYNDKSEKIAGRRLLGEKKGDPQSHWPAVGTLADVFEAKNVWHDRSWWLMESAHNEDELKGLARSR